MNRRLPTALILLLISFVITLLVGGRLPYLVFHVLLLYVLLPYIHNLITLYSLSGSIELESGEFYTGDKIGVKYLVRNRTFLHFPYLLFSPDLSRAISGKPPADAAFYLKSKDVFSRTENTVFGRRGYYKVGGFHVTINDVFGLYTFKKTFQSDISLLVYPEIVKLSSLVIPVGMQPGELLATNSSYRDKNRIASLREYREGDSTRSIHWKATSKRDFPVVKQFETRSDTSVELFIDSVSVNYNNDKLRRLEDKVVESATSIVHYCLSNNISISLNYENDGQYYRISGREFVEMKPFLDGFAKFCGNGKQQLSELLETRSDMIRKGSSIILITTSLNVPNGSAALELAYKGLNPVVISITDKRSYSGFVDTQVEGRLREEGIPVFVIDFTNSLSEILEVYHD